MAADVDDGLAGKFCLRWFAVKIAEKNLYFVFLEFKLAFRCCCLLLLSVDSSLTLLLPFENKKIQNISNVGLGMYAKAKSELCRHKETICGFQIPIQGREKRQKERETVAVPMHGNSRWKVEIFSFHFAFEFSGTQSFTCLGSNFRFPFCRWICCSVSNHSIYAHLSTNEIHKLDDDSLENIFISFFRFFCFRILCHRCCCCCCDGERNLDEFISSSPVPYYVGHKHTEWRICHAKPFRCLHSLHDAQRNCVPYFSLVATEHT